MKHLSRLFIATLLASTLHSQIFGDEIWTFQFTPTGSRPYSEDGCRGDCRLDSRIHADVAGTFSLLLNRQTGAGKPIKLNGTLSNFMTITGSGDSSVVSYETPTSTALPAEIALVQSPGHFLYQQNGLWRLIPDGFPPDYPFYGYVAYDIWFTTTSATFTAPLPRSFLSSGRIENAFATLIGITTAGDFNSDARIDARDYISLRKSAGSQIDYSLWRNFYGTSPSGSGSGLANTQIPEPFSLQLLSIAILAAASRRPRRS